MAENNVDAILIEWGKWSRGGLGALSAGSPLWKKPSGALPDICDELALRVDAAVVALGLENIVLREVIELSYRHCLGVTEIGLRIRVGRHAVEKYLAEARGFICGHLSVLKKAA